MALLRKTKQRITISGEEQDILESIAALLHVRKLKDAKISSLNHGDDQWQFSVGCNDAEAVYSQEVLPLLYESEETQLLQVVLEFSDANESVKHCPNELLVSFSLS